MRTFAATFKALFAVLWMFFLLPFALVLHLLRLSGLKHQVIHFYYKAVIWAWNIRIICHAPIDARRPLLMVSNHVSYVDVVALGALTQISFTPKSEIAGWPVIGFVARVCDAVFIERRASKTVESRKELLARIRDGARISLFPEGTTGNGLELLPFKSSLLSVAEEKTVGGDYLPVLPVTLYYSLLNGEPIRDDDREKVAWVGDAEFFPHVWNFLHYKSLTLEVLPHPPVTMGQFASRKEMAAYTADVIGNGLKQLRAKKSP